MKKLPARVHLVICVFALTASASTNPRDLQWRFSGTTNNLRAVTSSSQAFVAVGDAGTIVSSTDTITWNARTSRSSVDLYGITYGNNMFVAVGGTTNAEIVTSPNGVDWARQTPMLTNSLRAVAWGANVFVAVGDQGAILVSTNGLTWSKRPTGLPKMLRAVDYVNAYWAGPMFIAVGDGGSLLTSPDGLAWTIRSSGVLVDLYCVTAAPDTRGDQRSFLAAGAEGIAIASNDGVTWTAITIPTDQNVYAATAAGAMGAVSVFALAGSAGLFLSSDAATSWQTQASGTTANWRSVLQVDGEFLAVGDGGTIRCGRVYLRRNAGTIAGLSSVTWGSGKYVAVGETGTVLTSPDGATWNQTIICPENLSSITYGANRFVAVGDDLRVAHSIDGQIWNTLTLPVPADVGSGTRFLDTVAYGNGTFIASGSYPIVSQQPPYSKPLVFLSTDGENWQQVTNLPPGIGYFAPYLKASAGSGAFLLSGENLFSSSDGVTWTARTPGYYDPIIHDGSRFLALSGDDYATTSLAFSSDGTVWTPISTDGVVPTSALGYGNGTFVAVGVGNGIRWFAESTDGTNWISGVFSYPNSLQGVTFGDHSFVIVGSAGLISQSVPDTLPARLQAISVDQGMDLMIISEPGRAITLQSSADLRTWDTGFTFVPTTEVTQQHISTDQGNTKFFRVLGP